MRTSSTIVVVLLLLFFCTFQLTSTSAESIHSATHVEGMTITTLDDDDEDSSGGVSADAAHDLEFFGDDSWLAPEDDDDELGTKYKAIFAELDKNNDKVLTQKEFVNLVDVMSDEDAALTRGGSKGTWQARLHLMATEFDFDKNDTFDVKEFVLFMRYVRAKGAANKLKQGRPGKPRKVKAQSGGGPRRVMEAPKGTRERIKLARLQKEREQKRKSKQKGYYAMYHRYAAGIVGAKNVPMFTVGVFTGCVALSTVLYLLYQIIAKTGKPRIAGRYAPAGSFTNTAGTTGHRPGVASTNTATTATTTTGIAGAAGAGVGMGGTGVGEADANAMRQARLQRFAQQTQAALAANVRMRKREEEEGAVRQRLGNQ